MEERGKGEEVQRGSGSTSSLSSSCCRRAVACWAQLWPCAEIPAVCAAQPAPCQSCASSRLGREMGHMAAYGPEARKCKGLVCLVQEHKSWQDQSHSALASVCPKGHRTHRGVPVDKVWCWAQRTQGSHQIQPAKPTHLTTESG